VIRASRALSFSNVQRCWWYMLPLLMMLCLSIF